MNGQFRVAVYTVFCPGLTDLFPVHCRHPQPGVDGISCYTFNTFEPQAAKLRVLERTLVKNPNRTAVAPFLSMIQAKVGVRFAPNPNSPVLALEVWDVTLDMPAGSSWNTTANPVLMCDIDRFRGRGAIIKNTTFACEWVFPCVFP